MQIDLPNEAIQKALRIAEEGEDTPAVIIAALNHLEQERQEVAAVRQGIEAYRQGDHESLEDFDHRFRKEHGIQQDR